MAQTALISRRAIAVQASVIITSAVLVSVIITSAVRAQSSNSICDILDSLPRGVLAQGNLAQGTLAQSAPTDGSIDALRLLDSLDVQGRHRFVLPLPRVEAGPAAQRLRETLQGLQILDGISSALDAKIHQATSQAEQAAENGEHGLSEGLRLRALGLRSIIAPTRNGTSDRRADWPGDNVRVSRATEPYSLLAWNSGSYSVATTPHFSIASQAGERPTADMAQACELAYMVWSQIFATKLRPEQVDAPKSDSTDPQRSFRVVMFRTRDAYVKALRAIEPKIGVSTGYYSPRHRISFFYWDGAKSLSTLVHELTHQFFHEWKGSEPGFDSDRDPGFWVIEGVALYVESFSMQKIGGAVVIDVGGWDSPRLQAGRYRRLHDEYWIAWEEFSQLNGDAFRNSKEIAAWYSQACGLVHRWLDGSEQECRQFDEYLDAVYSGKGAEAAMKLSHDDQAMRSAYDHYLLTSWHNVAPWNARTYFANRREAVLARCEVTSQDLLDWPIASRQMDWLDLSFSKVDDRWLVEAVDQPWQVTRLNLESTATSDASLPHIAAMKELKELDLTQCRVTDEGIAALHGHSNLRQLWLGQTQITDASVDLLLSLPRLERINIEGSGISDQGWKRILAKKPYLKNK